MTTLIETINHWGEAAIPLAGQMLWQTSLLIIVLLALDLLLRHRIRAGFRYALWMLLLVKLVLPPSLALPTGAGYWIERPVKVEAPVEPAVAEEASLPAPAVEVNHPADPGIIVEADFFDRALAEAMADAPPAATTIEFPVEPEPAIQLTRRGQLLTAWLAGTLLLLGWLLWRWRWVNRLVRASEPAPADPQALLADLYRHNVCRASCPTSNVSPAACRHFPETARTAEGHERKGDTPVAQSRIEATRVSPFRFFGMAPGCPKLRLTDAAMSPAVCGLLRPVILLPRKLVGKLSREQLGTVLLHELIHLRRRDLWVNCAQTLLQIAAWWHPLLWLANARIRRVREEAVDEAVACALRDDADAYPTTLLEVAKLTFTRPLMTLGLVGILESKHALKQRIRRLLELPPLESTRLKWWQWVAVAAIALTALPMAQGQRRTPVQPMSDDPTSPTFSSRAGINYNPRTDLAPWENPQAEPEVIGYEYLRDGTWTHTPEPPNSAGARLYAQVEPASNAPAAKAPLITREFKINPNTFYLAVQRFAPNLPPSANDEDTATHLVRGYLESVGIKLEPPKSIALNERTGSVLVRATSDELAMIERAIGALMSEPRQITLEVRTVELEIEDRRELGFTWSIGTDSGMIIPVGPDTTNSTMAILTDPSFRTLIKALEQRRGAKFNFVPRIATLSGSTTDIKLREIPLVFAPKFGPLFEKLEIIPYAMMHGANIQATIISTIRTRAGDQGENSPHAYMVSQKALTADMKDGQTLMFAVSASLNDSEKNSGKSETLVFITPTIIDPAGNRVNETQIFENQGSLSPQSGVGNPAAGAPQQFAAVNTTRPPITVQMRAVKLSRRAWQELTNRVGTQAVSDQAQAFIHPEAGLDDWLAGHAEVETIESGRITAPERRTSILGAGSTDAASRARIELTTWRDTQGANQVWLQLNAAINWSGPVTQDGGPAPAATDTDPAATGSAGVTFGTNTRGYVNQQLATAGVMLTAGQWAIIGGPAEGQTEGPVFAVVASPLFAQSGSNRDSAGSTLGDGAASNAPPQTGTSRRLTGDQIDHIYVLKGRMFFKAADGATAEGLENGLKLLSPESVVAISVAPEVEWSEVATLIEALRVKGNSKLSINRLTDAQSAALESSSGALNNSATGSPGELPPASEQPDAAKRTYGWLVEQAPEWRQSWGMRQPSPPFKLPHTNLTEYGAQMITAKTLFPDPRVSGYRAIGLEPRFVLVPVEGLSRALGGQLPLARPLIIASNDLAALTNSLIEAGAVDHSSASPARFSKMSGGVFHWQVAKEEPSQVNYQTADNPSTNAAASPRQIVFGARHGVTAFAPDWVPLTLLARPFAGDDESLHSILSLATGEQQPVVLAQAEETIPPGASLVWASTNEMRSGFAQAVILHNSGPPAEEADESADGAGEAAAKIQNAKELIQAGKLDEAEALLREAALNAPPPRPRPLRLFTTWTEFNS